MKCFAVVLAILTSPLSAFDYTVENAKAEYGQIFEIEVLEHGGRKSLGPAGAFEQDVAVLGAIGARNRLLP